MLKKTASFVAIFLFTFIFLIQSISFNNLNTPFSENEKSNLNPDKYELKTLYLPEKVSFAGEKVPIKYFDVRESLERELYSVAYFHSNTFMMLKKANRFFPVIEPILKKNGIPDDFKFLAITESGLGNVVSPAGAVGFWQFMEKTGKEYGLEINQEIDERYNLEKATKAACKYLLDKHKTYNNWAMVAASYNMGKAGLDKQIERQKEKNYYNLLLNPETARYVYRILAYKIIMAEPTTYGFYLTIDDVYPIIKTTEIEINSEVENWADFAKKHHTNYKILKYFNPWLRSTTLTNTHQNTYKIKVPKKNARTVIKENSPNRFISYPINK